MPSFARLRRRSWIAFALCTVAGTGCDLSTKSWAAAGLTDGPRPVLDPWLSFSLAYNRGTAFSVVPNLGQHMWIFAAIALLVAAIVTVRVFRNQPRPLESLALGSIVAGALGNGFDRAFRTAPGGGTGVVDFIAVVLPGGARWPTFNVADVLLFAGVAGLILLTLARARSEPPQPELNPL